MKKLTQKLLAVLALTTVSAFAAGCSFLEGIFPSNTSSPVESSSSSVATPGDSSTPDPTARPKVTFNANEGVLEGDSEMEVDENGNITDDAKAKVNTVLHQTFRPEFLNRLDEIVFYKPLTRDNISHIVDLLTAGLAKRLEEKNLKLTITPAAKELIIDESFDPVFGARPMKRYIQSHLETLIARALLAGDFSDGATITVDNVDGELKIA